MCIPGNYRWKMKTVKSRHLKGLKAFKEDFPKARAIIFLWINP
jgi:hypothetical protein